MFFNKTNNNELFFDPKYPNRLGADAGFGCSATWGEGVEIGQDWCNLLNLYNGGQPGSSNDRICRLAIEYINQYSPNRIYVLWTLKERREFIDENNQPLRFNPTHKPNQNKFWHKSMVMLGNEKFDNYNYIKNKTMLEAYCGWKGVELYQLDMEKFPFHKYPLGSDGMHPGKDWHINIAKEFYNA